jgi:hypothetical protein
MKRTSLLVVAALVAGAGTAAAQPSDKQIKKDMTSDGTISVKLVGKGTVQANTDTLNYEYVRGVEIKSKTEWKGINVIITGDAVYQRVGKGKFTYWKFRVIDNRYEGIPNPSATDIAAVLATDWAEAFGGGISGSIVKVVEPHTLAPDPQWVWHEPKSVSFKMLAKVDRVVGNTDVETQQLTLDVRLYRDTFDGPWQRFLVSPDKYEPTGQKKTYTYDEINKLMRLPQQVAEGAAKEAAAKLPKVTIPAFKDVTELARFVHAALRTGPRDRAEAILRAVLLPDAYVGGSTVQLSLNGQRMVSDALDTAFGTTVTYAQQYCAQAVMDLRGSKSRVAIVAVKDDIVTSLEGRFSGTLVDGVEQGGTWMLANLVVRTKDDDKTRAWIASFSDREKLCPND